jgi:hypothetical protein
MLDQATMGRRTSSRTRHPWLRRIVVVAMILLGSLLFLILIFRFVNPPLTTVMVAERLEGAQPLGAAATDLGRAAAGGDRR